MPTILIVDDDQALTRALALRLRGAGFEVVAAHSADEASRMAVQARPDLILLDIDLPHYSGLELHECLKFARRACTVPVVYLSGNDSLTNRAVAFQQGARAFLRKPYDPQQLLRTIQEVLARQGAAANGNGRAATEGGDAYEPRACCG